MPLRQLILLALVVCGGAMLIFRRDLLVPAEPAVKVVTDAERLPICPWRDPRGDLQLLFPEATSHSETTHVLSTKMAEIQKKLGRPLSVDENPLRVYHPVGNGKVLGAIMVRRVKGEHGGIELVTAVDNRASIVGVLVQSHREPEAVAEAVARTNWLGSFRGKTAASPLRIGTDIPIVRAEAAMSAQAIVEGVRSQLILLGFAPQTAGAMTQTHTNH